MMEFRRLWLLFFSCFLFAFAHAQNLKWMIGTWNGPTSGSGKIHIARTLVIDSVSGENFTGSRSYEADDNNQTKIVTFVSGYVNTEKFYLKDGKILYKKDPPHGKWVDCNSCASSNKIIISKDSIVITCSIIGCGKSCDGVSTYYKLLPDYDTATQRELVNLFGTSTDIETFQPYVKKIRPVITAERKRAIEDSISNAENLAKKRQQAVDDSLNEVALVAKKRQQEMDDSLKNATLISKKRREQVDDSLRNIANIEKKKRQQQIEDSLKNAAIVAKKRQQEVDDSLRNTVVIAKKRQQAVEDSLRNVAVLVKKREQEVNDSLKNAAVIAKKRQQQVDDSLRNAAAIAKKRQREVDDSLKNVANIEKKLRQQQIDDSLANAALLAKKRQQEVEDSLKNAAAIAAKQPAFKDSTKPVAVDKVLEQRDNVLIQSFHIATPDILIELFDNAQIDGDMVSVYHNNELIVSKQKLLREAIRVTVHADSVNRTHEFILVAENLGTIPPNTALMRITAGKQIYQLNVKTDLEKNAKIILYYDGN